MFNVFHSKKETETQRIKCNRNMHAARYYYFVTGQVDTKMQYVVWVAALRNAVCSLNLSKVYHLCLS